MDFRITFIIAWVVGASFSVAFTAALLTYVVRTWQQIRADGDGGRDDRILDAIERLEIQVGAMTERLAEVERRALPGGTETGDGEAGR